MLSVHTIKIGVTQPLRLFCPSYRLKSVPIHSLSQVDYAYRRASLYIALVPLCIYACLIGIVEC